MSADIGPGDYVECISSRRLTVGGVYVVQEVRAYENACLCHGSSPFGLVLSGIPQTKGFSAWCGLNFRPVYRPKADAFDHLLVAPAPELENV